MALSSAALRAITLLTKFGLILYLGKFMGTADFGVYGILVSVVTLAYLVYGLEFYQYSTRKYIASLNSHGVNVDLAIFWPQLLLHVLLYVLSLPLIYFINDSYFIDVDFYCLLGLLIVSHVNQEMSRYLVAEGRVLFASVLGFLRYGFWVVFYIPLSYLDESLREVGFLASFWLLGEVSALLIILLIRPNFLVFRKFFISTNELLCFYKSSFKFVGLYLLGVLLLRSVLSGDRIILESVVVADELAAYVFFSAIAYSVFALIESGILFVHYPKIVGFAQNKTFRSAHDEFKLMLKRCLLFGLSLSIVGAFFTYVLAFVFYENFLPFFVVAIVFYCITVILPLLSCFQYFLYAFGRDRDNFYGNLMVFIFFIIAIIVYQFVGPELNSIAMAMILLIAISFGLILKYSYYKRFCLKYRVIYELS